MPSKSKAQQRFFGVVKGIQKGSGKGTGKAKKAARDMSPSDVDDFASTKHKGLPNRVKQETKVRSLIRKMVREIMAEMREGEEIDQAKHTHRRETERMRDRHYSELERARERDKKEKEKNKKQNEGFAGALKKEDRKAFDNMRRKQSEVLGYTLTGKDDIKVEIDDATVMEIIKQEIQEAKRDYKAEYKKYGSSKKAKKYRAELNAYNRKKGTYGNGDKKDASHKGGKIVGFEEQSKNRGRAEKSRLKKEGKMFDKFRDHEMSIAKLYRDMIWAQRKVPNKKKEIMKIKKLLSQLDPLVRVITGQVVSEGKLNEAKQLYVVASEFGHVYSGDKGVSEKKALQLLSKISKQSKGQVNPFMLGVQYWNKPHKYNKKKIMVKEGKLNEAKESIFDVGARVMKDKQAQKYKSKKGMVMVDMQSANLLTKVWKKVNPNMKKILSDLGEKNPKQLMATLWAVVK